MGSAEQAAQTASEVKSVSNIDAPGDLLGEVDASEGVLSCSQVSKNVGCETLRRIGQAR
jgi:hypothetical protein